jgi:hypothetical protein
VNSSSETPVSNLNKRRVIRMPSRKNVLPWMGGRRPVNLKTKIFATDENQMHTDNAMILNAFKMEFRRFNSILAFVLSV